jgi:hypothetical protein
MFYVQTGKLLHLNPPITFNEKLQWLKLYDRNPRYVCLVDKYAVKEFVANTIGMKYVIPTLGVWDNPDSIEWDNLPNQFVLKTTHGGGGDGVFICRDKTSLKKEEVIARMNKALCQDLYVKFREWPYKGVKKRIIAEKYMYNSDVNDMSEEITELTDYKFYCFDGKIECVLVCKGRQEGVKYYYFDRDWNFLRWDKDSYLLPVDFTLPKPRNLDVMLSISSDLSKGIPHVRVDLYEIDGQVYFGELTFYTSAGYDLRITKECDIYLGTCIKLK